MAYQFPRQPRASKKWRYILVIPDVHVGYVGGVIPTYSISAWDIAMQALAQQSHRLTDVVILGDFGNWEPLSHWAGLRAEQCFIKEDVALCNARLDEIQAITAANGIDVWFCEGNHEAWASQFEAKYPAMRDAVNLKEQLRFRERGWAWIRENHFLAIGDIYFTHGHLRGVKSPKEMAQKRGASVIYGHTHQYATGSTRTLNGEHAAWTFGCLASIDPPPPYSRGEHPDSWVHGFGFVQVRANGRFQVSFRRIIEESWAELEDGTELRASLVRCKQRYAEDMAIMERMRQEFADRYYLPGGNVENGGEMPEPHHGKVNKNGVSTVALTRRARIIRTLPDVVKGGSL